MMQVCACGFANSAEAEICTMCGSVLPKAESIDTCCEPEQPCALIGSTRDTDGSVLVLANTPDDHSPIHIAAPGGILGRAGDFSPELFSPRVSAIHARLTNDAGHWYIEHLGRNKSAILRGDAWIDLPLNHRVELLPGDQLKLADMLFRLTIRSDALTPESKDNISDERPANCDASNDQIERWTIICPVCGTHYEVEGKDARLTECNVCVDALDKRKIAAIPAKLEVGQN